MLINAMQVAHFVISECTKKGMPVSNLSLQKILYFLQREYMKKHENKSLFFDEFYAWQYGPVIPAVYNEYSGYGGGDILALYEDCDELDDVIKNDIKKDIERLAKCDSWYLVKKTHEQGTPWSITYNGGIGDRMKIDKELIANDNTKIV